jgi:hypothetical protein
MALVNTDPASKPGQHWLGVYKAPEHNIIYDSFGRTFKIPPRPLSTMPDAEQDKKETNCGQRSLAWLMIANEFGPHVAMLL